MVDFFDWVEKNFKKRSKSNANPNNFFYGPCLQEPCWVQDRNMEDDTRPAVQYFHVDVSAGLLEKYGTTDVCAINIAHGLSADFTLFPAKKKRARKKASKEVCVLFRHGSYAQKHVK